MRGVDDTFKLIVLFRRQYQESTRVLSTSYRMPHRVGGDTGRFTHTLASQKSPYPLHSKANKHLTPCLDRATLMLVVFHLMTDTYSPTATVSRLLSRKMQNYYRSLSNAQKRENRERELAERPPDSYEDWQKRAKGENNE